MCGIFAWVGKDPKKFNKDKFDKLGLYNIERGKDSCGVTFDGEIYYGLNTDKLYSKFIVDREIHPVQYPVVIGHTRSASVGNIVNSVNAHPFGFGTNDSNTGYEFIGCHNGTLYNHKELGPMFNVKTSEEIENVSTVSPYNKYYSTRQKIDSEILLEIIYKNKNFKVLGKYNGAAALVFTNTNEPNVLYVWKGASKLYDLKNYDVEEERPLFYYKETKNSLYISSIQESLEAIGGKVNKNLFTFKPNNVYKIIDGDVENAELTPITRVNSTQKDSSYSNTGNYYKNHTNAYSMHDDYSEYDYLSNKSKDVIVLPAVKEVLNNPNCKIVPPNIYNEKLTKAQNEYAGRIYFNKFRFWQNGHLVTGIYTWIKHYGFYKIGEESISEAEKNLYSKVGLPFIKNDFVKDPDSSMLQHEKALKFIPFQTYKSIENNIHYFIDGVKVQTPLDYSTTYQRYLTSHIKTGKRIDHTLLSDCACHPIIDMSIDGKDCKHQGILFKNKILKENYTFFTLGAEKSYTIEDGNLISYRINDNLKEAMFGTPLFKSMETIDDLKKHIVSCINIDNSLKEDDIDYSKHVEDDDLISDEETVLEIIDENVDEVFVTLETLIEDCERLNFTGNDKINKKLEKLKTVKDYLITISSEEDV